MNYNNLNFYYFIKYSLYYLIRVKKKIVNTN